MQQLIKQPSQQEARALKQVFETHNGQLILELIARNAEAYLTASCDSTSDAKSRQAQGAWMAMQGFINTAKAAQQAPGQ